MRYLAAIVKLVKVVAHLLHGLLVVYVIFPKLTQAQKNKRIEVWAGALLAKFAIKFIVNGRPPKAGPVLLVSNHISWLDILVIHAAGHCRFVSKSDIKHWPVLGTLTTSASTLYIERESRRDAMRVVHHMSEALTDGDIVAVFPEGTTGNGVDLLPFHANLLQAAIATATPVQALALRYEDAHERFSPALLWLGQTTLAQSVWATLNGRQLTVVIEVMPPRRSDHADRRALAAALREDITTVLAGPP